MVSTAPAYGSERTWLIGQVEAAHPVDPMVSSRPYAVPVTTTLGWLRLEPDVMRPPVRVWRDWLLAASAAGTAIVEAIAREDMVWPPVGVLLGVLLALAMLWRRTHPLAVVALGFGAFALVDLASVVWTGEPFFLYAGTFVVVLVFSLFRWGTSRQAAIGSVIALAEWIISVATDVTGVVDAVGGLVVLLFAAALGLAIRYRRIILVQRLGRVRSDERELLSRELHDTVAHHVSAIAIQAQAGRVLAASDDLPGATDALASIEREASRALTEMRAMVTTLRRRGDAQSMLTQRGVADVDALSASDGAPGPRVEIQRMGDLTDLRPPVQAALYRVAQESITNAKRHARHASTVHVRISGGTETVRLSVTDDGEHGLPALSTPGHGLVGMAERVSLLGGTLDAGPLPGRGWTVEATIPRDGGGGR